MAKRKKRLIKQIEGLRKQVEKHKEKLESEKGRKDTTKDYWMMEIEEYEKQAVEREKLLEIKKKIFN